MKRRLLILSTFAGILPALCRMPISSIFMEKESGRGEGRKEGLALGINLSPINYWSDSPFIDRFKASGEWTHFGAPILSNKLGYPLGMADKPFIGAMVPCEPGKYIFVHDGDIQVELQNSVCIKNEKQRVEFDARGPMPEGRMFIIHEMKTPPTAMHLFRDEDESDFNSGRIFKKQFLREIEGFDTLRFMDWQQTNSSIALDYDCDINSLSYTKGVPLAVMLELVNINHSRAWVCVPHLAEKESIRRMITTIASHAKTQTFLEYSNEVWNSQFQQNEFARKQAVLLWGAGSNAELYYGFQAGKLATMSREANVRVVLGCQTVQPLLANEVWEGVRKSGATEKDFGGWIVAAYVSGTLTQADGPAVTLAARNDVEGAIDNILYATESGSYSVKAMEPIYAQHKKIASEHMLPLLAYESNLHLNTLPNHLNNRMSINKLFSNIVDSVQSARVMDANIDTFSRAGGELMCLFNLSSGPTDWGYFGLLNSGSWASIKRHLRAQQNTIEK